MFLIAFNSTNVSHSEIKMESFDENTLYEYLYI